MKRKRGQHTSVDRELKRSIAWLESFHCISRVIIGLSESARHAYKPGTLRVQMEVPGGLKLNGYGGRGVCNIFIKIEPEYKQEIVEKIKARYA